MKIIHHIGLEKTGTTSIQSYLTKNRAALLEAGVLYPQSLSLPNNHLITALSMKADRYSDIREINGIPNNEEAIKEEMKKVQAQLREEIE